MKNNFRKTILEISPIVLSLSLLSSCTISSFASETSTNDPLYLEEEVVKNDIIVGITETGASNMVTESFSLDFQTEVLEFYVKTGQYIKKGDVLASLDTTFIEEEYEELSKSLEEAYISLEKAVNDADSQKSDLADKKSQTVTDYKNADLSLEINLQKDSEGRENILKNIEDKEEQLSELQEELENGYPYELDEQRESICEQMEDLTEKIYDANEDISKLYDDIDEAENDSQVTDEKIEQYYDSIENLTEQICDNYETIAKLQEDLIELENDFLEKAVEFEENLLEEIEDTKENISELKIDLDMYDLQSEINLSKYYSDYDNVKSDYDNSGSSYNSAISEIDDELYLKELSVSGLEEELSVLEELRETNELIAESDGLIISLATIGNNLNAGSSIVTISKMDTANVLVSIPQEDISNISIGMPTKIIFDAYNNVTIDAEVDSISVTPASGMQSTVNYTVTIVCDLSSHENITIYEGMTAEVTFIEKEVSDVLVISNKCIVTDGGKQSVLLKNSNGEIESVEVTTGFSDGFDVEIKSGLQVGDIVVIESVVNKNAN